MNDYMPPLPNYTFVEDVTFVDPETIAAALAAFNSKDAEVIAHVGVEYMRKGTTHYENVNTGSYYRQSDDEHVIFLEIRLPSESENLDAVLKPVNAELEKRDATLQANFTAEKAAKVARLQEEIATLLEE